MIPKVLMRLSEFGIKKIRIFNPFGACAMTSLKRATLIFDIALKQIIIFKTNFDY